MEQIRILILDDDDAVRISLESYFEDCGYICNSVSSAEEAIEKLEQLQVDIAIVDLRLPGMDGMNFIRTAHSKWPVLKYIIFTGSVDIMIPEDISQLRKVSDTIFLKPIDNLNLFTDEIKRLLNN